jgi:hypothetical protein
MKLYFWANPYKVAYGESWVIAVAETLDDAKRQAAAGKVFKFGLDFSDSKRFPQEQSVLKIELGEPTRVVDLPCAEWHEWSE